VTLLDRLRRLITREGPLSVDRYMDICLHDPEHGYYATRPQLGEAGDFITAPLVSQMFGELLGLWAAEVWTRLGRPERVRLVELGPGHGVMMGDALRAAKRVPGFLDACEVWLVETSAPLRRRQAAALEGSNLPRWASRLGAVPADAPMILLANEFLDCLPIRQGVRSPSGWRERRVGLDAGGGLAFSAAEPIRPPSSLADVPVGTVAERSDALRELGSTIGALVVRAGGAALFIDYGRAAPGPGDTLQALRGHRKESPLACPGEADLTAHVDFPAFLDAARATGAEVGPIRTQGAFLRDLGIDIRAAALAAARPDRAGTIARQLQRLIGPDQMGELFKVAVVCQPSLAAPGFEVDA
jgi:NADH dehydrogenase [ubiquinone] 1 alpha subcomplex assembly factor 7